MTLCLCYPIVAVNFKSKKGPSVRGQTAPKSPSSILDQLCRPSTRSLCSLRYSASNGSGVIFSSIPGSSLGFTIYRYSVLLFFPTSVLICLCSAILLGLRVVFHVQNIGNLLRNQLNDTLGPIISLGNAEFLKVTGSRTVTAFYWIGKYIIAS